MNISQEDFEKAINIANEAGERGVKISITYVPPTSATQSGGSFVTYEYRLTATGGLINA